MSKHIRIGSRGSDLALWQAHFFQDSLKAIGVDSEIIIITTKGDRIQHLSFDKIEGKGFFTKEIEDALLNNVVDVAIHSHKDLETQSPPGLKIAGVSYRENPSELLLIHPDAVDLSQPLHFKKNAVVGTSSARRKGQISELRHDITIKDIRGNVPTRVNKLREGQFDAILIAFAGIHRLELDLSDLKVEMLDPRLFIPAPAQGVLAYQCREGDHETSNIISNLHDQDVSNAIQIERGILSGFGGGCHIPIGAHATPTENGFRIRATFSKEWESFSKRVRFEASNLEEGLNTFKRLKETALPSSIFISKDIRPDSYLSRACAEHKLHLTGQSLIQISHLPFQAHAKDCDWVFFSSSNSVEAFFSQEKPSDWASKKFATAGEATANALGNYISSIDFIGSESDMGTVSREFKAIIGEDKVLFPISDRSLRSIQTELDDGQSINIVCYSTKPVVSKIDIAQAYILTSPSNVEVFLEGNDGFPENAKLISIGKSTAKKLNEHGFKSLIAEIPHESELWALLAS